MSYECSNLCAAYNRTTGLILIPAQVLSAVLYSIVIRKTRRVTGQAENTEYSRTALLSVITFLRLHILFSLMNVPGSLFELVIDIVYKENHLPVALYVPEILFGSMLLNLVILDPIIIMRHQDMRDAIIHQLKQLKKWITKN